MCGVVGRGRVSPERPLSLWAPSPLGPRRPEPSRHPGILLTAPSTQGRLLPACVGQALLTPPQHGLSSSLRMHGTDAFSWKIPRAWVTQTNRVCASLQVSWIRILSASSEGRSSCRHHRQGRLLVLSAGPAPSFRGRGQLPSVSDPLILKITF